MLVSFIGSPCSGKTTTASAVFAKLKSSGIAAEYIPEYARIYIAEKRVSLNLKPTDPVILTDEDQHSIMLKQLELETTFKKACGKDVVLVSDTCSLGALLYMTEAGRRKAIETQMVERAAQVQDYVFLASPVQTFNGLDPNRVHSYEQSIAIHNSIPNVMATHCPGVKLHLLKGDSELREYMVSLKILEAM